jgi:hypothetical protein
VVWVDSSVGEVVTVVVGAATSTTVVVGGVTVVDTTGAVVDTVSSGLVTLGATFLVFFSVDWGVLVVSTFDDIFIIIYIINISLSSFN